MSEYGQSVVQFEAVADRKSSSSQGDGFLLRWCTLVDEHTSRKL